MIELLCALVVKLALGTGFLILFTGGLLLAFHLALTLIDWARKRWE